MNTDISIFPIFDQAAPGVWTDFMRIRAAAMDVNYRLPLSRDEIDRYMAEYETDWRKKSFNFAFGAYDDMEMIGFIRGDCVSGTATVNCLYVHPTYQGARIGRRLLAAAERAVAHSTNYVELVSLGRAEKFYQHSGYVSLLNTNKYTKNIRGGGHCAAVPLFRCSPRITRVCTQISTDFDAGLVGRGRCPAFMYVDADGRPTGFAIIGPDNQPLVRSNSDWARRCLDRECNGFVQHRISQSTRGGR